MLFILAFVALLVGQHIKVSRAGLQLENIVGHFVAILCVLAVAAFPRAISGAPARIFAD